MSISKFHLHPLFCLCLVAMVFFSACGSDDSAPEEMMEAEEEMMEAEIENYEQEISITEKSTPAAFVYSATWCLPCSYVSKPGLTELQTSSYAKEALLLSCHVSNTSELYSPHARTITSMLGGTGGVVNIPFVKFSDKSGFENPGTVDLFVGNIENKIDELKQNDVVAAAGYRMKIENGKIFIRTKTEFFSDATGNYSISPIVFEDKVPAIQADLGVVEHDGVMRISVEGPSTRIEGELFTSLQHPKGTTYENEFILDLDADWNTDNLNVALVIWTSGITGFSIVNVAL